MTNLQRRHVAYKGIYEQYANDASFLWLLRSISVNQPHYDARDMLELEQRLAAQLDGLMTSVDIGWEVCEEALELQEAGEVFTAMVVAMRSHESRKIQQAVEVALQHELAMPGLVSAMGWLPDEIATPWIGRFLNGKEMGHKYLGIASCSVRRHDPGELLSTILQRSDCQQHELLYARALRLVGELRRQDCMPALHIAMNAEHEGVRFWANWSAVLLGDRGNIDYFKPLIFKSGPNQIQAIQVAFRIMPVEQARQWISQLSEDEVQVRAVIIATGVLGDPHAVNWLISKMADAALAKLAAESFSYITGIDLEKQKLTIATPDGNALMPNDDVGDDNVALDEDENLPYPDADKISAIWRQQGQSYIVGRRYFMGQPIATAILNETLSGGNQRQRHAASLELGLNEDQVQMPNTRARIFVT
jgi:uncharacterized protein (TIGR02270 family)